MKLLVAFGTRPEIVKLAPVVQALRHHGHTVRVVATGQHFDPRLADAFIDDLGLVPDVTWTLPATESARLGMLLTCAHEELVAHRPDAVVVLGDTHTVPLFALAARRQEVPVLHVEAGLRSFNPRSLEESHRRIAATLASLQLRTDGAGRALPGARGRRSAPRHRGGQPGDRHARPLRAAALRTRGSAGRAVHRPPSDQRRRRRPARRDCADRRGSGHRGGARDVPGAPTYERPAARDRWARDAPGGSRHHAHRTAPIRRHAQGRGGITRDRDRLRWTPGGGFVVRRPGRGAPALHTQMGGRPRRDHRAGRPRPDPRDRRGRGRSARRPSRRASTGSRARTATVGSRNGSRRASTTRRRWTFCASTSPRSTRAYRPSRWDSEMIRAAIFDLDDTLYPQADFLEGAWRAVALASGGVARESRSLLPRTRRHRRCRQ